MFKCSSCIKILFNEFLLVSHHSSYWCYNHIFIFMFIMYFLKYLPSKHAMCDFPSQIIISKRHIKAIKIFRILFFLWKKNPHNLLQDIYVDWRIQTYYVIIFICRNILCITLSILTTKHIWVQTIKDSIQLSYSLWLHFITCRNYGFDIHFGPMHHAITHWAYSWWT